MSDDLDPAAEDRTAERWAWILWGALVAVAVAVFEVFQQPALLGATISLKFAWTDARTGWWLWGRDPDRRRGQAHFWTYLGYGLWKASLVGIGLSLIFSVALAQLRNPPPPGANGGIDVLALVLAGSCLSGVFAALLAALVTFVGLALALAGRRKLWLNSTLAAARVRDHWPPDYGDVNRLSRIALPSAMTVVGLAVGAVTAAAVLALGVDLRQQPVLGQFVGMSVLLGVPVLALLTNDLVRNRLTAVSTHQAWPNDPTDDDVGA